jgi:hypothetical protein
MRARLARKWLIKLMGWYHQISHSAVRHGTVDLSTTILEEVDTSAMRRVASSMKLDVHK